MEEKELEQYIAMVRAYSAKLLATPGASRDFLMRAGIVDAEGNLTEPYRPTGNEDDEISYRYPRGRKNINKSVLLKQHIH
jgi:hypothetical protein